jgi:hypothetical protein
MSFVTRAAGVLAALFVLALDSHAQKEALPGTARVQIVNATSVAAISLRINDRLAYENFPQGLKSADSPTSVLKATYEAEDKKTGSRAKSRQIIFEPGTNQSLVILGDFSTDTPTEMLRNSDRASAQQNKQYAPNVHFQVFLHAEAKDRVRLRIINGMTGRNLAFVADGHEIVVRPGHFALLDGQPTIAEYLAKSDDEQIPLLMRQEGLIRNAMIVFFLKGGRLAFMRVFENTTVSGKPEQLERE